MWCSWKSYQILNLPTHFDTHKIKSIVILKRVFDYLSHNFINTMYIIYRIRRVCHNLHVISWARLYMTLHLVNNKYINQYKLLYWFNTLILIYKYVIINYDKQFYMVISTCWWYKYKLELSQLCIYHSNVNRFKCKSFTSICSSHMNKYLFLFEHKYKRMYNHT